MKRILCFLLTVVMILCFTSCKDNEDVNVYVVDGAPAVSVSNMLEKTVVGNKNIKVNIVPDVNSLTASITNKSADIAVVPMNIAATLYNKGIDIRLLSVNVFGALYGVGKNTCTLNELTGKVVVNLARGGTPDITMKYLLEKNSIPFEEGENAKENVVVLRYVSSAGELIPLLKSGKCDYGVLSEPAVSQAVNAIGGVIAFDLKNEWQKINSGAKYTQAGTIIKASFYENNKEFVKLFYKKMTENCDYIVENSDSICEKLQASGSNLKVNFTTDIINRMNLGAEKAIDIKPQIETYLNVLLKNNSQTVGGKLPANEFYLDI